MNDFESFIDRLEKCETGWSALASVKEDLFGAAPGLTKTDISAELNKLKIQLEEGKESGQVLSPLLKHQLSLQITNLENYIKQHLPSNPSAHIPGLLGTIYGLNSAIEHVLVGADENTTFYEKYASKLQARLAESISRAEVVERLLDNTRELIQKNEQASADLTKTAQVSQDVSAKIQERDRATLEATNRVTETEKKSGTLFLELEGNLQRLNSGSEEIKKQQKDLEELSSTLQKKLNEAQHLLDDANRFGLAGAFKSRKEELVWPARGWIGVFMLSIIGLVVLEKGALAALSTDWHQVLARLPFSAPFIWLGWFSVKQYGYTRRMQEDYSFKVASAMSYQGYKNEVDSDSEMLKKLRESAIENFSANPIRIYDSAKNHGSPLHELFEHVNDDKLKTIVELVKIFPSKK